MVETPFIANTDGSPESIEGSFCGCGVILKQCEPKGKAESPNITHHPLFSARKRAKMIKIRATKIIALS